MENISTQPIYCLQTDTFENVNYKVKIGSFKGEINFTLCKQVFQNSYLVRMFCNSLFRLPIFLPGIWPRQV